MDPINGHSARRCAPRRPASLRQGQKYRRGRRLIPNDRTRRGCFREAYNLDPANLRRARAAAVGIIKYNVLFPSFTCTYNLTFLVSRSFILRPRHPCTVKLGEPPSAREYCRQISSRRMTAQFARARAAAWKHAESGNFSFFSETETEKCKTSDVQQTQEITKEHVHLRRASVRQLPTPTAVVPRCRPCRSRSSYTATPWTVPDGLRRPAAA